MQKLKLVITDMDGTFLKTNDGYNKERFKALKSRLDEKGIKFVIASGRGYNAISHLFDENDKGIIYIADSGAFIRDDEKSIYIDDIPMERVNKIIDALVENNIFAYMVCCENCMYMDLEKNKPELVERMKKVYTNTYDISKGYENERVPKLTVKVETQEEIEILKKIGANPETSFKPIVSGDMYIDMVNYDVDKATAIKHIQELWKIADDEIVVFGDSENDLDMLRNYKNSYAVSNACDDAKECANFVCKSNNEEGVLECVEKLLENL